MIINRVKMEYRTNVNSNLRYVGSPLVPYVTDRGVPESGVHIGRGRML
jgi:hypothetical protein